MDANREKDRQWWKELTAFKLSGDVRGFYGHYAKYLEWSGVHSTKRAILLHMAKRVAKGDD